MAGNASPLAVGVVVLALLAGCAAGPVAGKGDLQLADGKTVDLNSAAQGAQTDKDRGTISGVVVDPAIRPIAGANLTVVGQGATARTDADGVFVIPNLKPGLYTILAKAKTFLPVQSTAEVKAGETAKVRMVLDIDRTPQPFHYTLKFKAFEDLGNGLVDEAWNLFLANDTGPVPGAGKNPFCRCQFFFSTDQQVTGFVVEGVWKDSVPRPGPSQCGVPLLGCVAGPTVYYWHMYDAKSNFQKYSSGSCTSPCRANVTGATYAPTARDFWISMYTDGNWVAYQQEYQVFVTPFLNGAAPKDWSFVKGDT
jgi:hypothetical protein